MFFCDLECLRISDNPPTTIPSYVLGSTSDRPDLVSVKDKTISIIELTIPFNSPSAFDKAHRLKTNKYQPLLSDIEAHGYRLGNWSPWSFHC